MRFFDFPYVWRPAAEVRALEVAATLLDMTWPAAIRALYAQHDGSEGLQDDWEERWARTLGVEPETVDWNDLLPQAPFLLSLEKAASFYTETKTIFPNHLRLFWTDHQSNYVGVYVAGPLEGMVCLVSHDGPDYVPVFRTVQEYLDWLCAHPLTDLFGEDRPTAFPTRGPDPEHDAADRARAQRLMPSGDPLALADSPELQCALSLTPYGDSARLLPFLDHPDFYVVERAVDILTLRRFVPAHARIEQLSRDARNTSNGAAQQAMQVWPRH